MGTLALGKPFTVSRIRCSQPVTGTPRLQSQILTEQEHQLSVCAHPTLVRQQGPREPRQDPLGTLSRALQRRQQARSPRAQPSPGSHRSSPAPTRPAQHSRDYHSHCPRWHSRAPRRDFTRCCGPAAGQTRAPLARCPPGRPAQPRRLDTQPALAVSRAAASQGSTRPQNWSLPPPGAGRGGGGAPSDGGGEERRALEAGKGSTAAISSPWLRLPALPARPAAAAPTAAPHSRRRPPSRAPTS